MGNHPVVDLMVQSPNLMEFSIDVKGLYKRSFWIIERKPTRKNLYYVLAFVPKGDPNRFFVLSQADVDAEISQFLARSRANGTRKGLSTEKVGIMPGLPFAIAERFENKWEKLPS